MLLKQFSIMLVLVFCSAPLLADDWVDNWISQSTYSRPNTYDTQQRGYFTGGKLSIRYRQDIDHLINVSPPSFKKGCGGIDLFGGSINYLDADRLIAKFETIMGGALATYAYDLALNVLCEPCAKEIKSLEALVDRINQLQIDDCKATKAIVAYSENETGIGDSEKNTEAISDFLISSGISKSATDYYDVVDSAATIRDIQAVMQSEQDVQTGHDQWLSPLHETDFFL